MALAHANALDAHSAHVLIDRDHTGGQFVDLTQQCCFVACQDILRDGVTCLIGDFHDPETQARVKTALDGPADVVLSDMAAPASGHTGTDHLRIMALAEAAFDFAEETLAPGGAFVVKLLAGGAEAELLGRLKRAFAKVRHVKPQASRSDSAELYLVATGFRGGGREASGTAG